MFFFLFRLNCFHGTLNTDTRRLCVHAFYIRRPSTYWWLHLQSLSLHWRPASRRSYVTRIRWSTLLAYTNDSTSASKGWKYVRFESNLKGFVSQIPQTQLNISNLLFCYQNRARVRGKVVRYLKIDGATKCKTYFRNKKCYRVTHIYLQYNLQLLNMRWIVYKFIVLETMNKRNTRRKKTS